MITAGTISVGTSPTLIITAAGETAVTVTVHGSTGNLVFLGDATVSTSNGFPIGLGTSGVPESASLVLSDGSALYGVVATPRDVNFIATS